MAKTITDIVKDAFAGVRDSAARAEAAIDATADALAELPEAECRVALAAILQKTAEKRRGAALLPGIVSLLKAAIALAL